MRKMMIAGMLVSLVAVAAPALAAVDPDPNPSVGVWACLPSELKPKPNACNAVIPMFPTLLGAPKAVTSLGGNIDKVESDDDAIGVDEKDPIALASGGISYDDPLCAAGTADGSIQIGDASDIFDFTYVRAGATAAVLATSVDLEEIFIGTLAFRPKNQDNTGDIDPQELALRCAGMWTGSQPLKIEFVGGGLYLEPLPGND